MQRLGEILLEMGVLTVGELHTGLDACHTTGGRLGTQLLAFGFVDEVVLLEALSEQSGAPSITASRLLASPVATRKKIPLAMCRQLQAVPFDASGERLRVAMANPRDPAAVEEIAGHAGLPVEPYVATEAAIQGALGALDEGIVVETVDEEESARAASRAATDEGWAALWRPARLDPARLAAIAASRPPREASRPLVASFPSLAALDDDGEAAVDGTVDGASYRAQLQDVVRRDEVGDLLVRFAYGYLGRLCLFMVHRGRVVGWMARGQGVVVDDVQAFETSVDAASVFATVRSSADHYLGPLTDGPVDRALAKVLGDPPPLDVLLLPVRVKERTVAFLLGDTPGESAITAPVTELANAVGAAGLAFEMLILRAKIGR